MKSVAEATANLCPNAIGQYIFGALAHESHEALNRWYKEKRSYYKPMMNEVRRTIMRRLPGVIFSTPAAALYSVVDVRNICKPGFNAEDFVSFCASKGKVEVAHDEFYTLLCSPLSGFYNLKPGEPNPGDTQLRIAYVIKPETMIIVSHLFVSLFEQYENQR